MQKSLLEVKNLSKKYGDKQILDNIALKVFEGETVVIVGKNGSGKSTLINIVADLVVPDSGLISIDGTNYNEKTAKLKRGIVLQEYRVEKSFTGLDVLTIHGLFYDLNKNRARSRSIELLEFMGLKDYANKEVQTYSAGMKKRLQMAKALLHDPALLLLDEPTAEMDADIKKDIWGYLNKLKRNFKLGILISTHDKTEANKFGDELLVLENGKLFSK